MERLLTQMLGLFVERGLLRARGTQRTDSTHHIVAAVRDLHRLELVGETLHHALNVLAEETPAWVRAQVNCRMVSPLWPEVFGLSAPQRKHDRQQLAETIGQDGLHLLTQMYGVS